MADNTEDQDVRKQLREARRHVTVLSRVCRQAMTYLQGISALDQKRLEKVLRDSVRDSERFLNR